MGFVFDLACAVGLKDVSGITYNPIPPGHKKRFSLKVQKDALLTWKLHDSGNW